MVFFGLTTKRVPPGLALRDLALSGAPDLCFPDPSPGSDHVWLCGCWERGHMSPACQQQPRGDHYRPNGQISPRATSWFDAHQARFLQASSVLTTP